RPRSTPFPYTTLFRSLADEQAERRHADQRKDPAKKKNSGPRCGLQQPANISNVRRLVLQQNVPGKNKQHGLAKRMIEHVQQRAEDRKSTRLNSSHLGI